MMTEVNAMAADGPARRVRSEAEWQRLMAEFGRWDGSQASFRESRGVPVKTFLSWRRRRGLTGGGATGGTGGSGGAVAAAEPGWDGGLSPGGGVALRLRRP